MKDGVKKYLPIYVSVGIILTTGILEYYNPKGFFLSTICALVGCMFVAFFLLRYISRERKASGDKSLMAGIFSHGTQGILLTDVSGKIIMVNPFTEKLFGYNQNELQNQNINLLLRGVTFSHNESVSQPGELSPAIRKEVEAVKKNNTSFTVEITSNYYESSGKTFVASFVTDITVRKQHEQRLLAKKNELEIVNQQLEAFSYSVSHDLRSPLRGVGGYATMLREDYGATLDAEANRLLTNIEGSALRMGMLIDDLLTFSRLGRKEVRKSEIDMTDIAKNALDEINKSYKNRADVTIFPLHSVYADAALISHVMTNLLSNAIKYSSKNDQAKVEVSSFRKNEFIIFHVKDNGIGFDMNYSHKLFQVFQRLHLDSEFEGTGVGLAIAHRIVQKHDGQIWAESVENEGASFYFSLPAHGKAGDQRNGEGVVDFQSVLNLPAMETEHG
jgi:PAS domain S-box-containing protein